MSVTSWHRSAVRPDGAERGDPLGYGEWASLIAETEAHRTLGYLAWAVNDGRIPASDEQRRSLFERHAQLMHNALVIDQEARTVAEMLPEATFFKGVAAGHLDHDDPSLRCYQDVDALLPRGVVDVAVDLLIATGARRDLPPRTSDWDRRFAKDITFVVASGVEVDLHRTPVPGPFGFAIDLDALMADTTTFDLGGSPVKALGPERRAIASALALTAGEAMPRLAAALDMVGAIDGHSTDVDEVVRLAERWRIGALVAEGVRWTGAQLGAESLPKDLHEWAMSRQESSRERRWRRFYRSSGGTNTMTLLGAPLGMASWRDRQDYMRGLLWPSIDYRRGRDRGARPREWRTGAWELLGRGSR